jgi:DNA-binding transcriptional regulator YdaS (Cro superfamily)
MDLQTYLSQERGRQSALCRAIQAHAPDVSRWAAGERPVPLERCTAIERATDGAVKRWDLRPDDWHRIWPELIGAEGAPAVPTPDSERAAA